MCFQEVEKYVPFPQKLWYFRLSSHLVHLYNAVARATVTAAACPAGWGEVYPGTMWGDHVGHRRHEAVCVHDTPEGGGGPADINGALLYQMITKHFPVGLTTIP